MGLKHEKTRREKITADYRHQLYTFESKSISSLKTVTITNDNISAYPHVLHDVSKTGILTLVIIVLQAVLFFLLNKHMLSIPNLNY